VTLSESCKDRLNQVRSCSIKSGIFDLTQFTEYATINHSFNEYFFFTFLTLLSPFHSCNLFHKEAIQLIKNQPKRS